MQAQLSLVAVGEQESQLEALTSQPGVLKR